MVSGTPASHFPRQPPQIRVWRPECPREVGNPASGPDARREIHSARRFDRFEHRFRCAVYQIVSLPGRPTKVNAGNEVHMLPVL